MSRIKYKIVLLGLFLILIIYFGCGKSKDDKIVLRVGKDKMTLSMLEKRFQEAPPNLQSYLNTSAGRKQFMDLLVRERAVIEAARQAGYRKSKDYKNAIEDFRKDQARQMQEYKDSLLVEIFVRDLHGEELGCSDQEIEQYYKDHEDEFKKPLQIKARHILLASKEEAEKALSRVKSGEDFSKIAKELSIDPISSGRGGQIGPFTRGDLVPEFEKAVFALKLGKISNIVETQFGYHIIKKDEEKIMPARTLEESAAYIKRIVEKAKFDSWLEGIKTKYNVMVDYDAVSQITLAVLEEKKEAAKGGAEGQKKQLK